jgi:Zn-dependent M28 family amino/carboxypeptidase
MKSITTNQQNLTNHVRFLTELNPARNYQNIESLAKSSEYIEQHFESLGLETRRQVWTVYGQEYSNVVARYTSPRPLEKNEARPLLVVGAHYDVAGDQPGADDNASAVAGLLETARLLAELKPDLAYDIELVGYCLEEPPFFGGSDMGSYVHAKSLHDAGILVKGMICYEMIGYYSDEPGSQPVPDPSLVGLVPTVGYFIGVIGRPENGEFNQAFYQAMAKDSEIEVVGIGLPDQHFPSALSGLVGMSDQRNYWKFGYPALMINDTSFVRNPHYHQVTDTIDTLDFDRLTQTVNSAYRGIVGLPS